MALLLGGMTMQTARARERNRSAGEPEDGAADGEQGRHAQHPGHELGRLPGRVHAAHQETAQGEQQDSDYFLAHRTPFVEGMPPARGSGSVAARRARATALYSASAMWCGSRAWMARTCSAICAWKAGESNTWRVSTNG